MDVVDKMNAEELLQYGFVVNMAGHVIYDDLVHARLSYCEPLLEELNEPGYLTVACLCEMDTVGRVKSPIFKYSFSSSSADIFQSAFYLADTLTGSGVLPIYMPSCDEVKDLMPLLNEEQGYDAQQVINILRQRYIKPECRHPDSSYMVRRSRVSVLEVDTIHVSDTEMFSLFGRLPEKVSNVVSLPRSKAQKVDRPYIADAMIKTLH